MYSLTSELHNFLSLTTWIFFLLLGLWGLYRAFNSEEVDGNYLGAMIIGQSLFMIQALLGIILYLQGGRPSQGAFHYLYGIFGLVFLPFIFAYLRGDDTNRAQWVYALTTLFLFGIALRAITTGR